MTEAVLHDVVAQLRVALASIIERRRTLRLQSRSSSRPTTCPTSSTLKSSHFRVPRRAASQYRQNRHIEFKVSNSSDVFMCSDGLTQNAICSASFLVRPETPSVKQNVERDSLRLRGSSKSVMNRLALKLGSHGPTSKSINPTSPRGMTRQPSIADQEDDNRNDLDSKVSELRLKVREVKVAEERLIRDFKYNPKQLLTQFSEFSMKLRGSNGALPKTPPKDPSKALVGLIEQIDTHLSTSEALSILKSIGIDYQPRSAFGRKNVMATDLSQALAPNGLKLASTDSTPGAEVKAGTNSASHHEATDIRDEDQAMETIRSSLN